MLEQINSSGMFGIFLLICIFALISMIFWISTLVYQARRSQWIWFVITLIFNFMYIFYWIFWMIIPKLRRKR
jgi:hypothetical protein